MVQLKETCRLEAMFTLDRFQFLMVQLKDHQSCYPFTLVAISIPYGSIKSPQMLCKRLQRLTISIPYGSIKSVPCGQNQQELRNFNSLWFN